MTCRNFGRNLTLSPGTAYAPRSEQEVLEILQKHRGQHIRCCGALHSWSRILEADDVLLDLRHLNSVEPCLEDGNPAAWLGAGARVHEVLNQLQQQRGWTLPSVGFITEQSIAGAISTGTHGSGRHSLSHYVIRVRIARYAAETGAPVVAEYADGDALRAARCSLGCMGVILAVQMRCRTAYRVEEHFREYVRLEDVIQAEAEYPLQQFYLVPWRWTYFAQHRRESTQPPSRLAGIYQWYRFLVFDLALHLAVISVARFLKTKWAVRFLYRRLVPATVPCGWTTVADANTQLVMEHERFRHLEIEWFVRADRLDGALRFLRQVLSEFAGDSTARSAEFVEQLRQIDDAQQLDTLRGSYCHHYVICIRRILADDTLVSMASPDEEQPRQHCYSITLTNYSGRRGQDAFRDLCRFLTRALRTLFASRPHWGKLFPLPVEDIRSLYPQFDRFHAQVTASDPQGVFGNRWTAALLDDAAPPSAEIP